MSRLRQLEDAHRALAAQHTALMEFVRAIVPLVPLAEVNLQRVLVELNERSSLHMQAAVMDSEYQAAVRKWLNVLSSEMTDRG